MIIIFSDLCLTLCCLFYTFSHFHLYRHITREGNTLVALQHNLLFIFFLSLTESSNASDWLCYSSSLWFHEVTLNHTGLCSEQVLSNTSSGYGNFSSWGKIYAGHFSFYFEKNFLYQMLFNNLPKVHNTAQTATKWKIMFLIKHIFENFKILR